MRVTRSSEILSILALFALTSLAIPDQAAASTICSTSTVLSVNFQNPPQDARCATGLDTATSQISREFTNPPRPVSDGSNVLVQSSMDIAVGGFRAFARTGGQVLTPSGTTLILRPRAR